VIGLVLLELSTCDLLILKFDFDIPCDFFLLLNQSLHIKLPKSIFYLAWCPVVSYQCIFEEAQNHSLKDLLLYNHVVLCLTLRGNSMPLEPSIEGITKIARDAKNNSFQKLLSFSLLIGIK